MGLVKVRFVVHEHRATRLHWDLRLEMDGVLKSWAIPKEPPINPGVRRLAILVEDHSLEYIDFEGEIPEGEYGAGTVRIWDSGIYEIESRALNKLTIRLFGRRMNGKYILLKMGWGGGKNWLLFKV